MKSIYHTTSLLVICLLSFSSALSQPDNAQHDNLADIANYYYVQTKDNTRFTGKIVFRNRIEKEITFSIYDNYEVIVLQSNIHTMRRIKNENVIDGDYIYPDITQGRNLVSPNGFGLRKGQLLYRTTNLLYHSLHYGLTENLSIHAGAELYTAFVLDDPAYHAGATFNYPISNRVRLGANISFANVYDSYKNLASGFAFATFGDANTNISLGYGYGYPVVSTENQEPTQFIPLNFKARLNSHLALISENWLFLNTENAVVEPVFSYGIRMTWNKYAVDLALVNNQKLSNRFTIGLPLVSFSYLIVD